jgi:hypothetical protein
MARSGREAGREKSAWQELEEAGVKFPPESIASFRAEVQRGGRIGIPSVERRQLGIREGDTVSVLLTKVNRNRGGKGKRG